VGENPNIKQHIPALDGLRGIAILLVLFSHSTIFTEFVQLRNWGLQAGYTGVSLFFVLSGYLITRLMLIEESQTGRVSLSRFFLRRAIRLFPALWLYLAVVATLKLTGCLKELPWHDFVSSFFYFRNFVGHGDETGHFWSLSLEEQFYLVWPAFFLICNSRPTLRFAVALTLIAIVLVWRTMASCYGLATEGAMYIRSDFRFDAPMIGCVLALLENINPGLRRRIPALSLPISLAVLGMWLVFAPYLSYSHLTGQVVVPLIGFAIILSSVARERNNNFLTMVPLIWVGNISYGLYIWHGLFVGPPTGCLGCFRWFPVNIAVTFFSAILSYRFVEKPAMRLRHHLNTSVIVPR
jgi:peptidoglycan/LPS O-acetylase OafA/YrhL